MPRKSKRSKRSKRSSLLGGRICLSPIAFIAMGGLMYMAFQKYAARAAVTEQKCVKAASSVRMQKKQCRFCSCTGEHNRQCCDPEICKNTNNCSDGESNPLWQPDEEEDDTSGPTPGWFDFFKNTGKRTKEDSWY